MTQNRKFQAELVGVLGKPVDENPVGVMFEAGFRECGIKWRYLNIEVRPDDLADAIKGVRAFNMRGVHITMPYKVDVLQHLDDVVEDAGIMGAVNTIRVDRNRRLIGENTDGKGFLRGLKEDGEMDPGGKNIVILGAGGAARAIAVELAIAGARKVTVVNRNEKRGSALAALINKRTKASASFVRWEGDYTLPSHVDVLVNATPIGFLDDSKPPIVYDSIAGEMVVCDLVPNKPTTLFLQEAQRRGVRVVVDGLSMLVYLGGINFRMWTGFDPPLAVMKEALKEVFGI